MSNNIIGKRFNKFIVLDVFSENGRSKCKCLCDCGTIFIRNKYNVTSNRTYSCGCIRRDIISMIGKKFGKLTVMSLADPYISPNKKQKVLQYKCKCDCGNIVVVRGKNLRSGHTQSCGCSRKESMLGVNLEDLTNQVFGYWTVLSYAGRVKEPRGVYVSLWHCKCKCGTERNIRASSLKAGSSLSCGCYKYKQLKKSLPSRFETSNLEKYVINFCTRYNINYEREVIFSDLKSRAGYPLSYDFKLSMFNFDVLIECQGKQHYEPIAYFGGKKQFVVQRENDFLKNLYAFKNNFYLLKIPYYLNENNIYIFLYEMLIKKSLFS